MRRITYLKLLLMFLIVTFLWQGIIVYKNCQFRGFAARNYFQDNVSKPKIYFIDGKSPYLAMFLLSGDEPKIVFLSGSIVLPNNQILHTEIGSNTSLIGIGKDAKIINSGIKINNSKNVIVRNITFENSPDDAMKIINSSKNIWIDHCIFENAIDGLCDITKGSDNITLSWNIFMNQIENVLIGGSNNDGDLDRNHLHVTLHHNWFKDTVLRTPRVRFGHVHVFNNYYLNSSVGMRATNEGEILAENNFFNNVRTPFLLGYHDLYPGKIKKKGNVCYQCKDGLKADDNIYNIHSYYKYALNSPLSIPLIVTSKAGVL